MDIQRPEVGSALTALFRLTGAVRPVLGEEIIPTVQVGDVSGSAPPGIVRHCAARFFRDAAAAQNVFASLRSSDVNTLAVIRRFTFWNAAGVQDFCYVFFGDILIAGATSVPGRFTDARVRNGPGGVNGAFTFDHVSVGGGPPSEINQFWLVPASTMLVIEPVGWAVLGTRSPNLQSGITFANDVLDSSVVMNIEWDEFQLP